MPNTAIARENQKVMYRINRDDTKNEMHPKSSEKAWQNWGSYETNIPIAIQADSLGTAPLFSVTQAASDPSDPTSYGLTTLGVLYFSILTGSFDAHSDCSCLSNRCIFVPSLPSVYLGGGSSF
jgi:hypothetical protein